MNLVWDHLLFGCAHQQKSGATGFIREQLFDGQVTLVMAASNLLDNSLLVNCAGVVRIPIGTTTLPNFVYFFNLLKQWIGSVVRIASSIWFLTELLRKILVYFVVIYDLLKLCPECGFNRRTNELQALDSVLLRLLEPRLLHLLWADIIVK